MGEREKGKEFITRGELFFLTHPGKDAIFSGYGLTIEEGSKGKLVGILMVDRPRPVDPTWLKQVEINFGEYQLVPMTVTGERGMVCQMEIDQKSQKYLRQFSFEKSAALMKAIEPLLENPPKPILVLNWNEVKRLWESSFPKNPSARG
jgi:hypothetical protein